MLYNTNSCYRNLQVSMIMKFYSLVRQQKFKHMNFSRGLLTLSIFCIYLTLVVFTFLHCCCPEFLLFLISVNLRHAYTKLVLHVCRALIDWRQAPEACVSNRGPA